MGSNKHQIYNQVKVVVILIPWAAKLSWGVYYGFQGHWIGPPRGAPGDLRLASEAGRWGRASAWFSSGHWGHVLMITEGSRLLLSTVTEPHRFWFCEGNLAEWLQDVFKCPKILLFSLMHTNCHLFCSPGNISTVDSLAFQLMIYLLLIEAHIMP